MDTNIMTRIGILALFALSACGGDVIVQQAESDPTAGSENTGPEESIEPEEEFIEEPEEPEPTGPGRIHAIIRMSGEEQQGTVTVAAFNGEVVAEGNAGDTFDVPSGEYRVTGMLDPAILPGHLHREDTVIVEPGETAEVSFRYEVARVRLVVRRNGRPVNTWRMVVKREGQEEEITMTPSREHVIMAPGRYSGILTAGASRIEVNGLIFQGGATMDVPVNVN